MLKYAHTHYKIKIYFKMLNTPENQSPITPELRQALDIRIEDAITNCEIATSPESKEAIRDYYEDHYRLASTIHNIVSGEQIDHSDYDQSLTDTPFTMRNHFIKLNEADANYRENPDSSSVKMELVETTVEAMNDLFTESSLGIITLSTAEMTKRLALIDQVSAFAESLGFAIERPNYGYDKDDPQIEVIIRPGAKRGAGNRTVSILAGAPTVKSAVKQFQGDIRNAGQLEYHSSAHIGQIIESGGIMPRNEQARKNGSHTVGSSRYEIYRGHHHSNVPHFSEIMAERPEYTDISDGSEVPLQSGTIAIPLARIIKEAPYARDALFGIVTIDESKSEYVPPQKSITTVGTIGAGSPDRVGDSTGPDRVFFSSHKDNADSSPDSYKIDVVGQEAGPSTVIFIYEDGAFNQVPLPQGEQFPRIIRVMKTDSLSKKRREIQKEADEKYEGMVIIPLRRDVFEFRPENAPYGAYENRSPARYTLKNIGVSAVATA